MANESEILVEVKAKLDALTSAAAAFQQLTAVAASASAALSKLEAGFTRLQAATKETPAAVQEIGGHLQRLFEREMPGLEKTAEKLKLPTLKQGRVELQNTENQFRSLATAGQGLPDLASALNFVGLGGVALRLQQISGLMAGIVSLPLGILTGGIGLIGTAAAHAYGEAFRATDEAELALAANNRASLSKLNATVNSGREAGFLRGEAPGKAAEEIANLTRLQNIVDRPDAKPTDLAGMLASGLAPDWVKRIVNEQSGVAGQKREVNAEVSQRISALARQLREQSQAGFATEEAAAEQHRQALAGIEAKGFDTERLQMQQRLQGVLADRKASTADQLKALEDFTMRERGIVEQGTFTQRENLKALRKEREDAVTRANGPDEALAAKMRVKEVDDALLALEVDSNRQLEAVELQHQQTTLQIQQTGFQRQLAQIEQQSNEVRRRVQKLADDQAGVEQAANIRRAQISGDYHRTEMERRAALIASLAQEEAGLDSEIVKLQTLATEAQAALTAARAAGARPEEIGVLEQRAGFTENALRDARSRRGNLGVQRTQLEQQPDPRDFNQSFAAQWNQLRDQTNQLGADLSRALLAPLNAFRDGLWSAFQTLFERGASAGRFFATIGSSLGMSLARALSDMVANWILSHVIMAGISRLFNLQRTAEHAVTETVITSTTAAGATTRVVIRSGEAAHDAAMTGVQVGTHAAGEGTKTGSTFFGSLARGAIRVGETIFHGIQVGIRTVTHLIGETLMTAVSIAQAAIRLPLILAETLAYVAMAAVRALAAISAIPFVGPFLAPAVAIGILALGAHLAGAFADGGETPDRASLAVVGERGKELVIPAHVNRNLTPQMKSDLVAGRLDRIGGAAGGGSAAGAAAESKPSGPTHLIIVDDRSTGEKWAREKGEAWFIEMRKKTEHRFA